MGKLKRARIRKGTTWFQTKRFNVDGLGKQTIIRIGGYYITIGSTPDTKYIRFGDTKCGVSMTSRPPFSVRNKYRKSIKVGKYYITKL